MRTCYRICFGVLLAGALCAQAAAPTIASAWEATPPNGTTPDVVTGLLVGTGPGEVGIEAAEEGDWGATAFAIAPDGTFWIVDGVNDKLLVIGPDGDLLRETPFPGSIECPEDIEVTGEDVYLLDVAVQPGVVARLGLDGEVRDIFEVPDAYASNYAVTGLSVQDGPGRDDVYLELDESWHAPFVRAGRKAAPSAPPLVRRGTRADVPVPDAATFGLRTHGEGRTFSTSLGPDGDGEAAVAVFESGRRARTLKVKSGLEVASVKALETDSSGRDFVSVEEYRQDGSVRSSVRAFGDDGRESGVFEIPTERFETYPHRGVRVSGDGEVYCLVPGRDRVTIERIHERRAEGNVRAATSAVPGKADIGMLADLGGKLRDVWGSLLDMLRPSEAQAAWTRLNANDRAWQYVNNSWRCSSANYYRSCGDYRPAYITASGKAYSSVPYCWGGFDTASTFNTAMKNGKDAGDVNCTGSKRSCTAGVDCSGFISRLWGLGTKKSTTTLKDVSRSISRSSMACADLYLRSDYRVRHAIAHRYIPSTGKVAVWESTTSSDKDRVVAWTRTADYLSTYATRRYQNW